MICGSGYNIRVQIIWIIAQVYLVLDSSRSSVDKVNLPLIGMLDMKFPQFRFSHCISFKFLLIFSEFLP